MDIVDDRFGVGGGNGLSCPLLVAVVGHHDLRSEELAILEAALRGVLAELRRRYANTPLVVLTGLEEGAGRLGARVAAERGIECIAVLPCPSAEFVDGITAPETRRECAALLDRAAGILHIAPGTPSRAREGPWAGSRAVAGDSARGFLVEKSHVVVALWAGESSGQPDGVDDLIRERTGASPPGTGSRWHQATAGEVWHISAGRMSSGPSPAPGELVVIQPRDGSGDGRRTIEAIERFNRELAGQPAGFSTTLQKSRHSLWPADTSPATTGVLREGFATFDALAMRWQRRSLVLLNVLFGFSWSALIFLQFCSGTYRNAFTIMGYLGCLAIAWACFVWSLNRRHQVLHLDCRAIAESLRVQFFWRLAGIADDVADRYLATHGSVLAWIRSVVSTVTVVADARSRGLPTAATPATLRAVDDAWLGDQAAYFNKATRRDRASLRKRKFVIASCFAVGSILTIVYVLDGFSDGLSLVIGVLMATGAVVAGHTESLALEEQANQYAQMSSLFVAAREAATRLLDAHEQSLALEVLRDTGNEAIGESMAWVALHKARPIRAPR